MKLVKVLAIVGTRPEAIKLAPVIKALEDSPIHDCVVCSTGQHREMLNQMVQIFNLRIKYEFDIMVPNQTLATLTGKLIESLDTIIKAEKPDWLLIQGDTTTCFAASLAAFYNHVKVAHVEAGLRTYNLKSPFPEEANRQLVAKLTDMHFAPTRAAAQNLLREGITKQKIAITGNTVIDTLLCVSRDISWCNNWKSSFNTAFKVIQQELDFVLITGHRRENHGEGFFNICRALVSLANRYPAWHFIYPVHLNPNVKQPVSKQLSNIPNIHLIDPLSYEPFVYLLKKCKIVLTDSGGVQEEAPSLGKPVLVMRNTSERIEGIEMGTAKLVGTEEQSIIKNVSLLIENNDEYHKMANIINPYGDGKASERIINYLV